MSFYRIERDGFLTDLRTGLLPEKNGNPVLMYGSIRNFFLHFDNHSNLAGSADRK